MQNSLFDIDNKIILITGSSRGLGLIMARSVGEAGATVVLNGRDKDKLGKTVKGLKEEGINAHEANFDVTDGNQISQRISIIEKNIGPIDVLVNNAGIQRRANIEDFREQDWNEIIDINLKGMFLTSKYVAKGMINRKKGKIINICSLQSELGRPTIVPYAASKGGAKMLTRGMSSEWAKHNIQVNGIGPGYFITDMTKPLAEDKEFDSWLKNRTPARRWGYPEELIGTLIFLCSKASDYVNGQIIYVDGGIMATI